VTTALYRPTPVVGWGTSRAEWLAARRRGLGASDVTAVLGFSPYRSPWQVWAEKTGVWRPTDEPSEAADLGNSLEPWLRARLAERLDAPVLRTPHQLYAHPEHPWRLASPDGCVPATGHGVECKTAGLAGGFGPPDGWGDESIPLGYEFQVRWQMHVCGWPAVEVVALLANVGVRHWTITRDLGVEADLVAQVDQWWTTHVVGGAEPPMSPPDNAVMAEVYPTAAGGSVDLDDTDAVGLLAAYRVAAEREKTARAERDRLAAELKRLLGDRDTGLLTGRPAVTWAAKRGSVDWARLFADAAAVAAEHGLSLPDPETYRRPPSRALTVKDVV
jgi:putative phage-type endonuclease